MPEGGPCAPRAADQSAAGETNLEFPSVAATFARMSTVQEIEAAIKKLPPEEMQRVHKWLEDFLEDQLEFTDEFKAEIARAKADLAKGLHSRIVQPE